MGMRVVGFRVMELNVRTSPAFGYPRMIYVFELRSGTVEKERKGTRDPGVVDRFDDRHSPVVPFSSFSSFFFRERRGE